MKASRASGRRRAIHSPARGAICPTVPQLSTKARRARLWPLLVANPDASNRELARLIGEGVDHKTIGRDRAWLADNPPREIAPPPPAEPGNQLATQHGCYSEQVVGPLRQQFAEDLARTHGWLDDHRRITYADLLAHAESANRWLEDKAVVKNDKGEPWPIVRELHQWRKSILSIRRDLDREARVYGQGDHGVQGGTITELLTALTADERRQLLALLDKAADTVNATAA